MSTRTTILRKKLRQCAGDLNKLRANVSNAKRPPSEEFLAQLSKPNFGRKSVS